LFGFLAWPRGERAEPELFPGEVDVHQEIVEHVRTDQPIIAQHRTLFYNANSAILKLKFANLDGAREANESARASFVSDPADIHIGNLDDVCLARHALVNHDAAGSRVEQ
jgi:hypothetical protein